MGGQLTGKVAIVTGAGRGIGRAIVERFAREGAQVAVVEMDTISGEAAAAALTAQGGQAKYIHADVSNANAVFSMVRDTEESFGPIDILVNNANAAPSAASDLDGTLTGCFTGPWLCMQAVLPGMLERRSGSIVNISSVNALMGVDAYHLYSGAKAGLIGMSRSMAVRYGRQGIRINVVCPGSIMTEAWVPRMERNPGLRERLEALFPVGRMGRPEEIAAATLYLAGPDAGFTTGIVLTVDGGLTAGYLAFGDALGDDG